MDVPDHTPVLMHEVIDLLAPKPGETVVDCTLGLGGHAGRLLQCVGVGGVVIGCDLDGANLDAVEARMKAERGSFETVHANFAELPAILRERELRADVVLADLGFASSQMDDPGRGLSFKANGPLDMRLDRTQGTTAADLVSTLSEADLADLIYRYGEDPFARRIARKLALARRVESIETTGALARLVREAYGPRARASRMDPATRTFMALRIAVNDELTSLERLLKEISQEANRLAAGGGQGRWLRRGARIGIISFHSLEDRRVKRTFAALEREGAGRRLTKKPVTASGAELSANPRARSAKLRAAVIAA